MTRAQRAVAAGLVATFWMGLITAITPGGALAFGAIFTAVFYAVVDA